MKNILLIICLLVGFPIASVAQTTTAPTISLNSGVNCPECKHMRIQTLAQQLSVLVDHTETSSDEYTLQVVYYTVDPNDKGDCLGRLSGCPDHSLDDVEACGCIAEQNVTGSSQPITVSTTLASIDGLTDFLCNDNFTVKIDVSVQLNAEGTEPIFSGMPVIVDIDVDPPEAPMIAPNLGSGEQALIVSLAGESVPDDVARHEICYAPRGSINAPDDCDINDSLTAEEQHFGYTAALLRLTAAKLMSLYLVTVNIGSSLLNDVEYEVVVAALDAVGNRSENSPSSFASPAELLISPRDIANSLETTKPAKQGDAQRQAQRPKRSSFFLSCCSV